MACRVKVGRPCRRRPLARRAVQGSAPSPGPSGSDARRLGCLRLRAGGCEAGHVDSCEEPEEEWQPGMLETGLHLERSRVGGIFIEKVREIEGPKSATVRKSTKYKALTRRIGGFDSIRSALVQVLSSSRRRFFSTFSPAPLPPLSIY